MYHAAASRCKGAALLTAACCSHVDFGGRHQGRRQSEPTRAAPWEPRKLRKASSCSPGAGQAVAQVETRQGAELQFVPQPCRVGREGGWPEPSLPQPADPGSGGDFLGAVPGLAGAAVHVGGWQAAGVSGYGSPEMKAAAAGCEGCRAICTQQIRSESWPRRRSA